VADGALGTEDGDERRCSGEAVDHLDGVAGLSPPGNVVSGQAGEGVAEVLGRRHVGSGGFGGLYAEDQPQVVGHIIRVMEDLPAGVLPVSTRVGEVEAGPPGLEAAALGRDEVLTFQHSTSITGAMIIHHNPEGLFASPQFSQAVEIPAGARLLFVGGQNGVDETGQLVGPDAASQTKRALENVRTAVEGAGGSFADVAKWTILTTSRDHINAGVTAFLEVWGTENPPPAITVAIITDLGPEGALVEVEAVAALPA
jgi:enamine deaminase RidA (YjgF/YER057c/UK114 family)